MGPSSNLSYIYLYSAALVFLLSHAAPELPPALGPPAPQQLQLMGVQHSAVRVCMYVYMCVKNWIDLGCARIKIVMYIYVDLNRFVHIHTCITGR